MTVELKIMEDACREECQTCDKIDECNEEKFKETLQTVMPNIIAEVGIDSSVFLANLDMVPKELSHGRMYLFTFEGLPLGAMMITVLKDDIGKIKALKAEGRIDKDTIKKIQTKYDPVPQPEREPEPDLSKLNVVPGSSTIH